MLSLLISSVALQQIKVLSFKKCEYFILIWSSAKVTGVMNYSKAFFSSTDDVATRDVLGEGCVAAYWGA